MKKYLILIVVSILIIMAFTACSKSEFSDNTEVKTESNNETNSNKESSDEKVINDDKESNYDKETNNTEKANDNIEGNTSVDNTSTTYELTDEGIIPPEFAKKTIEEIATQVITAISTKDSEKIAEFVHPDKGVRFTPYTSVSVDKDVILKQEDIKNFFENKNIYQWGYYDGTGDEISLTASQYYDEFIYTADFMNAEKIGYNEVLSSGNMEENQFKVYNNAIVVEYYFSGFNPDYEGADWKSLRLVFEPYENDWKLVGIIHNQRTL